MQVIEGALDPAHLLLAGLETLNSLPQAKAGTEAKSGARDKEESTALSLRLLLNPQPVNSLS